jgi:DegV family protein with EDD domain
MEWALALQPSPINCERFYAMKIVTDSAADMITAELQAFGIAEAPLTIHFPDREVSSADISADEFYDRLRAMRPAIPTTAQPSAGVFAQIYQQIAQTDKDILSVHISSGLSGTSQAAQVGASQVGSAADVTVWDTLTLSGGERFQVLAAAAAARAGWSLAAIQQRLTEIRAQAEVIYTLETLEYLARGGRIGRVQALAGAVLKIKPIIRVEHSDGKYSTVGKSRNISQALATIVGHLHSQYGNASVWVTVLHGQFAEQADALTNLLIGKLNVAKLEVMRISPVLGVHTGPGIVGAAVAPMGLLEDLIPAG